MEVADNLMNDQFPFKQFRVQRKTVIVAPGCVTVATFFSLQRSGDFDSWLRQFFSLPRFSVGLHQLVDVNTVPRYNLLRFCLKEKNFKSLKLSSLVVFTSDGAKL